MSLSFLSSSPFSWTPLPLRKPLRQHSSPHAHRRTVANRAFGHSLVDGAWTRTDQSPTSAVLGDGGIYSSLEDMAKWDAALYDGRLLSDATRTLAFSDQTAVPVDEDNVDAYGYGWRLDGGRMWHSGETIGFRNVIIRDPAQRLTVLVLTNRNGPRPYPLARRIMDEYSR